MMDGREGMNIPSGPSMIGFGDVSLSRSPVVIHAPDPAPVDCLVICEAVRSREWSS
jgi:hypothetical protein